MKTTWPSVHRGIVSGLIAFALSIPSLADQTITGNLTVTGAATVNGAASVGGDVDVEGNNLTLGNNAGNYGVGTFYLPSGSDGARWRLTRVSAWLWEVDNAGTVTPAMRLDASNNLTLYSGGAAALTLNPAAKSLSLGSATLTADGTGLTTNGSFSVTGTFSAPSLSSTSGTVTGGASGLALNAGGTDQNVVLSPSGNGNVIINGNLGIGTATPTERLHVSGQIKSETSGMNFVSVVGTTADSNVGIAVANNGGASPGQWSMRNDAATGSWVLRRDLGDWVGEKLVIAPTGNIDFSGALNLVAGSSGRAPLTFKHGRLLFTPVFGAVEFNNGNVYVTNNESSPTRQRLAYAATTLAGYGITDPVVLTTESYADPSWITALSAAKLTGTIPISAMPAFSGDATSSAGSTTLTLANSGVSAGTYAKVTVDAKGRVTAGASLSSGDVTTALGYTPVNKAGDTMTGALSATALTATSGTVTGGTAGLTLGAGGSNQNITLAPSGTGNTLLGGNVGIGTSAPSAKLEVAVTGTGMVPNIASFGHATGGQMKISADSSGSFFLHNRWATYNPATSRWEWTATTTTGAGLITLGTGANYELAFDVRNSAATTSGQPVNFVRALTLREEGVTVPGSLTVGGNFSAPNYTASSGTITGGSTGLTLTAGGTNQNVTLVPSGTGKVTTNLGDVAALSSNGFAARTGSGAYAARAIVGTAGQVNVANGDGVAGNPTISLPSTITQATTFSSDITFGGLVGVGATQSNVAMKIVTVPSSTTVFGIASAPTFGAAATTAGIAGYFNVNTAAAAYTMVNGRALWLDVPVLGAGSSVTTMTGLFVRNQGAAGITNAYGIDIEAQSGAASTNIGLRNAGLSVFSNTTASTSSTTGALTVAGGVGIAGDLNVGGTFSATSYTTSGGTVSGGAAGLTLNAGGTNQNVALVPSGTGKVTTNLGDVAALSSNGFAARTGSGAYAARAIVGTAGQINVANGDGVAGNPTISLPSTITQATTFSGKLTVADSTASTSAANGSATFGGGIGVAGQANIGGAGAFFGALGSVPSGNYLSTETSAGQGYLTSYNGTSATYLPLNIRASSYIFTNQGAVVVQNTTASNSTTTGSATFAGGIGVAGTVNARNVNTSYGLGALPAGTTSGQNSIYVSGSGDVGGTSDLRPTSIQATALGANSMAVRALDVGANAQNTAGSVSMLGVRVLTNLTNTGNGSGTAFSASPYVTSTGNLAWWVGYEADNGGFTSTGDVIGPMTAFRTATFGRPAATTVTAFHAQDLVKGSGIAAGFRGQVSAATGKYNLYLDGTAANLLAGQTSITNTTASTSSTTGALTVAGGVGINGDLNVGGTFSSANYTASGGNVTGGSTGLNLTAGGSNQNVVLTPSGTGVVKTNLGDVAALSTNGFAARTGSGAYAARAIVGTAGQVNVTNGDGVAGNPTVSLPSTITQATTFSSSLTSGLDLSTTNGNLIVSRTGTGVDAEIRANGSGANGGSILKLNAGTGGGFYSFVNHQQGGVDKWYAGVHDSFSTGNWMLRDVVNATTPVVMTAGAIGSATFKVQTTTPSTSTTTGSATFGGGIGVAGAIHGARIGVGAVANAQNLLRVGQMDTTAGSSGAEISHSGAVLGTGYGVYVTKTGASTTNVAGYFAATGATTNKALSVGAGQIESLDATDATSTTTGALQVAGGGSFQKNLYVGGNLNVTGILSASNLSSSAISSDILSGSASGLSLNAGGTGNQNVTLTPTGAGSVVLNGNVGIGTVAPAAALDISGSNKAIRLITPADTGYRVTLENNFNWGNSMNLKGVNDSIILGVYSGNTALMTGKVGIGTTAPAAKLDVTGGNIVVSAPGANSQDLFIANAGGRKVEIVTDADGNGKFMLRDSSATTTQVAVAAAGNSYFNGGNVGIGTNAPSAKLDVAGNANIAGNLRLGAGTPTVAPLTLQNGSVLTTATFGAVEFDGTNLYVTNNSASPTRKTIAYAATTLSGYGITDPIALTSGSYANPSWITSLAASKLTGAVPTASLPAFSGDATSSAGSSTLTLANSGVVAGTYAKVTVDAKGRVTTGAVLEFSDVTGALTYTPVNRAGDTLAGPLAATTLAASDGTLTGGVSGLTLNAGGTDKNITLTPSGTGNTVLGGKVGIGTASPSAALTIAAAANTRPSVTTSAAEGSAQWVFENSADADSAWAVGRDKSGAFWIERSTGATFGTGTTTQSLVIDTAGNVGIATTSPTAKLDVAGDVKVTGNLVVTGTLTAANSTGGSTNGVITGSTNGLSLNAGGAGNQNITLNPTGAGSVVLNGNVGIGTTSSPLAKFDVKLGDNQHVGIYSNGNVTTLAGLADSGNLSGLRLEGAPLTLGGAGGAEHMRIAANGNVGVGTNAPVAPLHVRRAGQSELRLQTNGRQWSILSSEAWGANGLSIYDATADVARLHIDTVGNVGIGTTSPVRALTIGATASSEMVFQTANRPADQRNYRIYSANGALFFGTLNDAGTSGVNHVMIDQSSGNVGIGTTNPASRLHVDGLLSGGIGAQSTGGVRDWNDVSNSRSGSGFSLLLGNDPNGPGSGSYFHPFNFEYGSKDGSGSITQLAIPYGENGAIDQGIWMRGRYWSNPWGPWVKIVSTNTQGNVGIGTTAPTAKLHVNGTARFDGPVRIEQQGDLDMGTFRADPTN